MAARPEVRGFMARRAGTEGHDQRGVTWCEGDCARAREYLRSRASRRAIWPRLPARPAAPGEPILLSLSAEDFKLVGPEHRGLELECRLGNDRCLNTGGSGHLE